MTTPDRLDALAAAVDEVLRTGGNLMYCDAVQVRSLVADNKALREALTHIHGEGCDAAAFYNLPMPSWDDCRDYEYREEKPTGDPTVDRCHRCLAYAALHREDGA